MNEKEPYLQLVLKSHDEELKKKLVELGKYEEYGEYDSKISSEYEEEIRKQILEHAIQIDALNSLLIGMRIRQLQRIKETMDMIET